MTLTAALPDNTLAALTQELDALVSEFAADTNSGLRQVRELVRDAVSQMDRSFQTIGNQHALQREYLHAALADEARAAGKDPTDAAPLSACLDSTMGGLDASSSALQAAVGDAVRALQFEDMVRQLLEHAEQRIARLADITAALTAQAGEHGASQQRTLERLCSAVAKQRTELREARHHAVTQTNMDAGDVELF